MAVCYYYRSGCLPHDFSLLYMKLIRHLFICFLLGSELVSAQCSMCRAVLESGADAKMAEQLNDGIVYLMIMPYLLVGIIGFIVYRKFYKK